mgnify:CR=1 FL=1|tara:strand:+ start:7796 stop:8065 length:270 start_codon:yes stop_codon:yes gene_type:complete
MFKKDLSKLDTDDLMSIKDTLRILETFLFNMQSLDKDLKRKKKAFSPRSRAELRKMFVFWRLSSYNVKMILYERNGKRGREPKKYKGGF